MTLLTGTSGNTWRDFANSFSAASSASISVVNASADHLAKHIQRNPKADLVMFAESPASIIAESVADSRKALDRWKISAAVLLTLWRKNRQRLTILKWNECIADPAAFEGWLEVRFGRPKSKAGRLPAPSATSLAARALADVIVARDRDATRLWNELLAASQPLSQNASPPEVTSPELALAELSQHQKRLAAEHSALTAERDSLLAKVSKTEQQSTETSQRLLEELRHAHKESEAFLKAHETSLKDNEILHGKLKAAEEEVGRCLVHADNLRSEVNSLRVAHNSDRKLLDSITEQLREEQRSHAAELSIARTQLAEASNTLIKTEQLLTQDVRDALSESEVYYERWKLCEASLPYGGLLGIGAIVRGLEKDEPPHRQIDFKFESLSLLGRSWRSLPVRLVEHDGNPGLVLFNPFGNAHEPLHHWQPDGTESGLDYMLFVTRNRVPQQRLFSAPASDFILIRELTASILGHLLVHGERPDKRWSQLARRLIQEIDEIPERLHYDSVSAANISQSTRESVVFNVANLCFRGRCTRNCHFEWQPSGSGGDLTLHQGIAGDSLLVCWTCDSQTLTLSESGQTTTETWARLTSADRSFLILLAKALPDFVFHFCEQQPGQKANKERLTKHARKLYSRLHSLDRRHRFKAAIAKFVRNRA